MKVVVSKYLNVRVGKPCLNAPCYQYLAPGSELEVDGQLYKGDPFDGIDTWMKDAASNYYWSGGVDKIEIVQLDQGIVDYNNLSILPAAVKSTKGQNIKIGIVDTGCFQHKAFKNVLVGRNFIDNNNNFTDISTISHGTFIAGILSAQSVNGATMKGIAPNVTLVIAKITKQSGISNRDALFKGLDWMIQQQPDIINCSFDFSPADDFEKFNTLFNKTEARDIIWVAAGQDNEGLFKSSTYYPAQHQRFVAVGSLRKEILLTNDLQKVNKEIKYLLEETMFESTDQFNLYDKGVGSSFASALVTGNLALIKSHLKTVQPNKSTPKDCIDFLDNNIQQLNSSNQFVRPFTIFKK